MKTGDMKRLAVLSILNEEPDHGYALHDRLEDAGFVWSHNTGGLYKVLAALDEQGLVKSLWNTPERGPARRVYQITPAGRDHLVTERKTLHEDILVSQRLLSRIPRS
jgi:DNA-binding PadR family transcriptional regulator